MTCHPIPCVVVCLATVREARVRILRCDRCDCRRWHWYEEFDWPGYSDICLACGTTTENGDDVPQTTKQRYEMWQYARFELRKQRGGH